MIPVLRLRERDNAAAERRTHKGIANLGAEGDERPASNQLAALFPGERIVAEQRSKTVGEDDMRLEAAGMVEHALAGRGAEAVVFRPLHHHAGGPTHGFRHVAKPASPPEQVADAMPQAADAHLDDRHGHLGGVGRIGGEQIVVGDELNFKRARMAPFRKSVRDGVAPGGFERRVGFLMADAVDAEQTEALVVRTSSRGRRRSGACGFAGKSFDAGGSGAVAVFTSAAPVSTMPVKRFNNATGVAPPFSESVTAVSDAMNPWY